MFKFPYTTFSQINLDWLLKKVKEIEDNIIGAWTYAGKYVLNHDTPSLGYNLTKSTIKNELLITIQSTLNTNIPVSNIVIPASALYSTSATKYNASGNFGDRENNLVYKFRNGSNYITITVCTLNNNGNVGCLVWGALSPVPDTDGGEVEIAVYYR